MQKLRSLYGNKKTADIQYWMKKMYSLRAKILSECKDVINQINEIFDIMNRNNANLGEWERIRILFPFQGLSRTKSTQLVLKK